VPEHCYASLTAADSLPDRKNHVDASRCCQLYKTEHIGDISNGMHAQACHVGSCSMFTLLVSQLLSVDSPEESQRQEMEID